MGYPPFRGASDYLIFQLSENAKFIRLEELSEHLMPQSAINLIKQMVVPEQAKRATIEDVLASEYFTEARALKCAPKLNEPQQRLRTICDDIIKRENVYRYEGKEKYLEFWTEKVAPSFANEENKEYWDVKI